jgi:hypothetical protein
MDNTHIRLVKDKQTAYAIYKAICSKYEGKDAHGDAYNIMGYLLKSKYKEGDNLLEFFLRFDDAIQAACNATGSAMEDSLKSMYLYNAMPIAWAPELQIWKGTRRFVPYEELKRQLEAKVSAMVAQERYGNVKGSPESPETQGEKALAKPSPRSRLSPPKRNVPTVIDRTTAFVNVVCCRSTFATGMLRKAQSFLRTSQSCPSTLNVHLSPQRILDATKDIVLRHATVITELATMALAIMADRPRTISVLVTRIATEEASNKLLAITKLVAILR